MESRPRRTMRKQPRCEHPLPVARPPPQRDQRAPLLRARGGGSAHPEAAVDAQGRQGVRRRSAGGPQGVRSLGTIRAVSVDAPKSRSSLAQKIRCQMTASLRGVRPSCSRARGGRRDGRVKEGPFLAGNASSRPAVLFW